MIERLEVTAGPGTVIRFGHVAAWTSAAASANLVSFLAESARNLAPSPISGSQLADHLAGVLRRRDPEPEVAFAVVGPSDDGWIGLLHGPVQVWDGVRWTAPDAHPGWTRVTLAPHPALSVSVSGSGVPPIAPDGLLDLESGVVPGGGFVLLPAVVAGGRAGTPFTTAADRPAGATGAGATEVREAGLGAAVVGAAEVREAGLGAAEVGAVGVGEAEVGAAEVGAEGLGAAQAEDYGAAVDSEPIDEEPAGDGRQPDAPSGEHGEEFDGSDDRPADGPAKDVEGESAASETAVIPAVGAAAGPAAATDTEEEPAAASAAPSATEIITSATAVEPPDRAPAGTSADGDEAAEEEEAGSDPAAAEPSAESTKPAEPVQPEPAQPPTAPAPPTSPAPPTAPAPPGVVDLRSPSVLDRVVAYPPLPPGGDPSGPVPGAPVVAGVPCRRGHLNRPGLFNCARCHNPIDGGDAYQVSGTRPALGCLVTDAGAVFRLDTGYVIGSEPSRDATVRGRLARPLLLASPDVAGAHAEIRLHDWDVIVTDRAAESGTHVFPPDGDGWERLKAFEPRVLSPGTHIAFGPRIITFLTPWTPRDQETSPRY
ncbi:MAG TPA: FHA domain-containing protein [Acidimicrobiales bacterium]|nr:FHA domain-containing protein [Acidimicrobiales bacterium]